LIDHFWCPTSVALTKGNTLFDKQFNGVTAAFQTLLTLLAI
tara:strand:- start:293 stop:415 length:123 start_codon:yes stop_codon:yes gene_type:complete